MDEILLGDTVKDRISGFKGIATARSEFLHGCVRILISPEGLKDAKPIESQWVDEPQLERVKKGSRHKTPITSHPGGPQNDHKPRAMPSR